MLPVSQRSGLPIIMGQRVKVGVRLQIKLRSIVESIELIACRVLKSSPLFGHGLIRIMRSKASGKGKGTGVAGSGS